jgi:hypothetical protein
MLKGSIYAIALAGALALSGPSAATVGRSFVATYGSDANTSVNCGPTAPCRSFNAALSVTGVGGEVVVLNSGGYGPAPLTISQSVTIAAPPGVYAGLTVPSGNAINIVGTDVDVTLRGLTLNGTAGGGFGISMAGGATGSLLVENCVIAGFTASSIAVSGATQARVVNTTVQDGYTGISVGDGAFAALDGVRVLNLGVSGVFAYSSTTGAVATVVATNTTVTGSTNGFLALSYVAGAHVRMSITRSVVAASTTGVSAGIVSGVTGGDSRVEVSDSLISANSTGLYASNSGASLFASGNTVSESSTCGLKSDDGGVVVSYGNNAMSGNATDLCGSVSGGSLK